jgi:hypothetical protein
LIAPLILRIEAKSKFIESYLRPVSPKLDLK